MNSRKIFIRVLILLNILLFYSFFIGPDKKIDKKVASMDIKTQVLWHRLDDYKEVAEILKNKKVTFENNSEFYTSGVLFFGGREELIQFFRNHQIYISQAVFYQLLNIQTKRIVYLSNGDLIFDNDIFYVIHTSCDEPNQIINKIRNNPPFMGTVDKVELLDSSGWYFVEGNHEPVLSK